MTWTTGVGFELPEERSETETETETVTPEATQVMATVTQPVGRCILVALAPAA